MKLKETLGYYVFTNFCNISLEVFLKTRLRKRCLMKAIHLARKP